MADAAGVLGGSSFAQPGLGTLVAVALVHHENQPVWVVEHVRLQGDQVDQDLRSSVFGLVKANATGSPCTVVTRCSRSPQKRSRLL